MSKVKEFLSSERVPRWQVVAFGLLTFAASVGTTQYQFMQSERAANQRSEQSRVQSKLLEIQVQSIEFQSYAGAFVSAVLDQTDELERARSQLVANIIAQDAAVDVSFTVFDKDTQRAATAYRSALRELQSAVFEVEGVGSMASFWTATTTVLERRNELLVAIENQSARVVS